MKNDMNEIRFAKILIREGNVIAVSHDNKGCVVLSILVGNTDFYGMIIKYDPEHMDATLFTNIPTLRGWIMSLLDIIDAQTDTVEITVQFELRAQLN